MAGSKAAELPRRWYEPTDEGEREGHERELQKELGPKHVLRNRPAKLIARREGYDDVLYELDGGQVAQVHLTWARRPEPDATWPWCKIFSDFAEWRQFWISKVEPGLDQDELEEPN